MPGMPRRTYHQPTAGLYRLTAPLMLPHAMYGTVCLAVGDVIGVRQVGRATALITTEEHVDVRVRLSVLGGSVEPLA